ncbi:hypothetical protein GOP47_0027320 [Adiantum capillus-veneris]|nr:hypothetical protein GOP47_0027320 [Adiantum capillus-veneris]
MDADLFLGTKIATGFPSGAASSHSQLCYSFHNIINNRKRAPRFFAGPPSRPFVAGTNTPPSYDYIRKLRELASTKTSPVTLGEKNNKSYTARDVALGLIDVFGWSVDADGKGEVGKVAEIVHVGRLGAGEDGTITPYEYLLKVVRPFSIEEESGQRSLAPVASNHYDLLGAREIKILIPIVNEFMQHIDPVKKRLLVKPPDGLLELAARPEAIAKLQPEIQLFCKRYASFLEERFIGRKKISRTGCTDYQKVVFSYMPTREQMFAVGRADLVRRIKDAGGFLYVAHALGLKTTRRPNGFWDDLRRLDFEIECCLLESWVKHVNKETGEVNFKNVISNEITAEKPQVSIKLPITMNGMSSSVVDVGSSSKVMPQMNLLGKAGRWDLHHAIVLNGGYREVAHQLGRRMTRSRKKSRH